MTRIWIRGLIRAGVILATAAAGTVAALAPDHELFRWISRLIPGASPLAVGVGALGARSFAAAWFWLPAPILIFGMALWRGRWFCRWLCPAGACFAAAAFPSPGKLLLKTALAPILFWTLLAAAALGFPLLLWLDPLAGVWRAAAGTGAFIADPALSTGLRTAGLILTLGWLLLFMLWSHWQPMVWCAKFCPLGYSFDLAARLRRLFRRPPTPERAEPDAPADPLRRQILTGVVAGVPLALLAPRLGTGKELPILPPGADTPERFASLCSRCYACVSACPRRVIRVKSPVGRGLLQWFEPEVNPARGYCDEFCQRCSEVCPTGALRRLTPEEKHRRQIGVARVEKDRCLAWADGEYCMVCDEFCPYHAIETLSDGNGLPRPWVIPDKCRGCGFCENQCPAVKKGKAILVHGVARQRDLA